MEGWQDKLACRLQAKLPVNTAVWLVMSNECCAASTADSSVRNVHWTQQLVVLNQPSAELGQVSIMLLPT